VSHHHWHGGRKAITAIWCLCSCSLQWRAIVQLCNIPLDTLFTLLARWTRLGLWRQLLDRLHRTWPAVTMPSQLLS
jgi:hypothetical protein